jgi:hypothetical protein
MVAFFLPAVSISCESEKNTSHMPDFCDPASAHHRDAHLFLLFRTAKSLNICIRMFSRPTFHELHYRNALVWIKSP